jgi:hypothetical protein
MQTVVGIVVGWFVISFTLGPLLTWAFFYPLRRERAMRAHDRLAASEVVSADALPTFAVAPAIGPIAHGLSA